jgi:hypothetical protein
MIPPAPPPLRPTPRAPTPPPELTGTAIAGRVVLEGTPVRYYGVIASTSYPKSAPPEPARVIRASDGRFRVVVKDLGPWDLVIAGPGFARKIIVSTSVPEGTTKDLGDIEVTHGHTIRGVVRDGYGAPVPSADIALVSTPLAEPGSVLDDLARGNLSAITSDDGSYEIDDVGQIAFRSSRPTITATTRDHRTSLSSPVPDADTTIDFTVQPVGTLEVRVTGSVQGRVVVHTTGKPMVLVPGHQTAGVYRVDAPAGDYEIVVFNVTGQAPPSQRITIVPGTVVSTTFALPVVPAVGITVHVNGTTCDEVQLTVPGEDGPVASGRCIGTDAEIPQVEPGRYMACSSGAGKPACGLVRVLDRGPQAYSINVLP